LAHLPRVVAVYDGWGIVLESKRTHFMKSKSTSKVTCPDCKKKEPHQILFSRRGIAHLRCPECHTVNPFSIGTSEDTPEEEEGTGKIVALMDHAAVMEKQKKKCAPYAYSNDYTTGDFLHHKTFGDGYVLSVLPSSKMIVLFADEQRLLRCGPNSQKENIIQFGEATSPYNLPQDSEEPKGSPTTPKRKVPVRKVSASGSEDAARECPKCGKMVHPYNLTKNPSGKVIACMNCKGR
jgi:predicted RNA-binding Zn-ribbon protein involved in translation (DUF1610 family)